MSLWFECTMVQSWMVAVGMTLKAGDICATATAFVRHTVKVPSRANLNSTHARKCEIGSRQHDTSCIPEVSSQSTVFTLLVASNFSDKLVLVFFSIASRSMNKIALGWRQESIKTGN